MPNPNRSATASIRGYLYQTVLAAQAWVSLEEGETLVVEGDEDFDLVLKGEQTSVQVKDWSKPVVSLKSESLQKSLKNFAALYAERRAQGLSDGLRFLFVTTQTRKPAKGADHVGNWVKREALDEIAAELVEIADTWEVDWPDAWNESPDWRGFVESVRFEFERPQLQESRELLSQDLEDDPRTHGIEDLESLEEHLILELLTASSRKEKRRRTRTKDDFQKALDAVSGRSAKPKVLRRRRRIREWMRASEQLGRLLEDGTETLEHPRQPSQLLEARYGVIPFLADARKKEVEGFENWFKTTDAPRVDVRILLGEGGSGKTRLAVELCRRQRTRGWHAGFVPLGASADRLGDLGRGKGPRLIVVDYAETRLPVTRAVLQALHGCPETCRIVLLARQEGPWLDDLIQRGSKQGDLLGGAEISVLTRLTSSGDQRKQAFEVMVDAFAEARGVNTERKRRDVNFDHPSLDLALMLAMAALLATSGEGENGDEVVLGQEELLGATLDHERHFWREWLESEGIPNRANRAALAVEQVVAAATLLGSLPNRDAAEALVERLLGRNGKPDLQPEDGSALLEILYSDPEGYVRSLRPDLLGEHLVARALRAHSTRLAAWFERTLEDSGRAAEENLFVVLGRLGVRAREFESQRNEVATWIQAALMGADAGRCLAAFEAAKTLGSETMSAPIAEILADLLEGALAGFLPDVHTSMLESFDRWPTPPVSLRRLSALCSQARVERHRSEGAQPEELAPALNNLGNHQSALGQREDALESTREAVEIYRPLAEDRPDAFLPDLASALNNLGIRHSNLGQREAALESTREAVEIYRPLAEDRPDAFLPDLAMSLNNLGSMHSNLGQREAALESTREAVKIRRQLAEDRPDAFLPDLAMSLNNLGSMHSNLGQHEDALESTLEAVKIRRQLAEDRPDAFLPDLAQSLGAHGSALQAAGVEEEAATSFREGLELLAPFAAQLPGAYRDLALYMANQLDPDYNADLIRQVREIYGEDAI